MNNFGLEYPTKDSTPQLTEVDSKLFGLELVWINFDMESTKEDYVTKSLMSNSIEGVGIIVVCFHPN